MKVEPSLCIWTDIDSNKKFLIDNVGSNPIYVNDVGQIPSRFSTGVTGFVNHK